MRFSCICAIFSLLFAKSIGQNPIPEAVAGTVLLAADDSPFVLDDDLIIEEDETLEIEPGVTVHVAPGKGVQVFGSLVLDATLQTPVLFTVDITSSQYDAENSSVWAGIHVVNNRTDLTINGLVLEKAGELTNENGSTYVPALWIEGQRDVSLR